MCKTRVNDSQHSFIIVLVIFYKLIILFGYCWYLISVVLLWLIFIMRMITNTLSPHSPTSFFFELNLLVLQRHHTMKSTLDQYSISLTVHHGYTIKQHKLAWYIMEGKRIIISHDIIHKPWNRRHWVNKINWYIRECKQNVISQHIVHKPSMT